ncbi:hypothetical protein EE612_009338, partial [Oryza sativa]
MPDGAVHELEHLPVARCGAARRAADEAGQPRRREQVAEAEPEQELPHLGHALQVLVPHLEPVADHGAHRRVRDQHGGALAHVHDGVGPGRGSGGDGGEEARHLLLPDAAERPHAPRAEQLEDADLAQTPVRAVAREREALAVGHHDAQGGAPRPRREVGVLRPEDLARGVGRRGHHERDLAEPEVHERRAVPAREVGHGAVHLGLAHQVVQAPDDRQPPRPRRKPRPAGAIAARPPRHPEQQERGHDES